MSVVSPRRPQRARRGQAITARIFNRLVHGQDVTIGNVPAPLLVRPTLGTTVSVVRARIVSVDVDLLFVEQVSTERRFYVAKPWAFRSTFVSHTTADNNAVTFSGHTANKRQATDSQGTEEQGLIPAYQIGDEIFCQGPMETGVTVPGTENRVMWVDQNLDGRYYGKIPA